MAVIWLPQPKDMMNATLEALRNLGGRGRKREIYEQMIKYGFLGSSAPSPAELKKSEKKSHA